MCVSSLPLCVSVFHPKVSLNWLCLSHSPFHTVSTPIAQLFHKKPIFRESVVNIHGIITLIVHLVSSSVALRVSEIQSEINTQPHTALQTLTFCLTSFLCMQHMQTPDSSSFCWQVFTLCSFSRWFKWLVE